MARHRDRPRAPGSALTPPGGVSAGESERETPRIEGGDAPSAAQQTSFEMYTSGPLPLPAILAGYKQVTPGLELEIVQWARENGEHRREMDREYLALHKETVRSEYSTQRAGLAAGLGVAVAIIALAFYALFLGHTAEAVSLVLFDLAALVGVFVYGSKRRRVEIAPQEDRE